MWPNLQFNADLVKVAASSSRLLIYVKYNSHIKTDNKLVLKEGKSGMKIWYYARTNSLFIFLKNKDGDFTSTFQMDRCQN